MSESRGMTIGGAVIVVLLLLQIGLMTVSTSPVIQNDVKHRTIGGGGGIAGMTTTTNKGSPEVGASSRQQELQKRRELNNAASSSQKQQINIQSQIKYYFDESLIPQVFGNVRTSETSTATATATTTVKPEVYVSRNTSDTENDGEVSDDLEERMKDGAAVEHGCTDCGQRFKTLTDPEIRQMRIAEIKDQILRKLRLNTPPNITIPRSMLPAPLREGEIALKGQKNFPSRNIEDFYGKMEQVIVMAETDVRPDPPYCDTRHYDPAACFYFKLTDDMSDRNIESAELWTYKLRDRRDRFNQTYVVSEFVREANSFAHPKTIVAISETDIKSGWIRIDVAATVKRWLSKPRLGVYGLQISCKTCSMNMDEIPVSYEPGEKPFIVINLQEEADGGRGRRNRRSVECTEGVTQCCRESLYVDFSEIGWNDWIVQPAGYYANYCKGSCLEDVAVPLSTSHHTTVMQYYVQKKTALTAQQKAVFAPCCTPTRMSNISLIYQDDHQKILQNNLPNMVVESCGCF